SRRRHTRFSRDWSSDVCSSDLQALGAANLHLDRLGAINREATVLQDLLHRGGAQGSPELRKALAQIGQRIAQMRGEWERPPHKPVTQQSMDAGSVELF